MSRHSDRVTSTAEIIARRVLDLVTEDMARLLVGAGTLVAGIVPSTDQSESSAMFPEELFGSAKAIVEAAALDDLREVQVSVSVTGRSRVLKCVVGESVSERMMDVADVDVQARIRTRWVHVWNDAHAAKQWVSEQGGA